MSELSREEARVAVLNAQAAVQSAYVANMPPDAKERLIALRWHESHAALDKLEAVCALEALRTVDREYHGQCPSCEDQHRAFMTARVAALARVAAALKRQNGE